MLKDKPFQPMVLPQSDRRRRFAAIREQEYSAATIRSTALRRLSILFVQPPKIRTCCHQADDLRAGSNSRLLSAEAGALMISRSPSSWS